MGNAALYQRPPDGLGDSRAQALAFGFRQYLGDDIGDPCFVANLAPVLFNAGGLLHISLPFQQKRHQRPIERIHARPDLSYVAALVGWKTGFGHGFTPRIFRAACGTMRPQAQAITLQVMTRRT